MFALLSKSNRNSRTLVALVSLLILASPASMYGGKKKTADATPQPAAPAGTPVDLSKLVWPNPPNIARVRWLNYFAGMKIDYTPPPNHEAETELDGSRGRHQAGG